MAPPRTLLPALSALLAVTLIALPGGALPVETAPDAAVPDVEVAAAAPSWPALGSATIRPGVQMFTSGAQCTSNFVFYEETSPGTFDIFLGYAAHCAGLGAATDTNGCTTPSRSLGTSVSIDGASRSGTLAYSSWLAMQAAGENPASDKCLYNDFALVKLHKDDHSRVHPSVLHFGGPTGLCDNPRFPGSYVLSYGNSGLRFDFDPVSPKVGATVFTTSSGWSTQVYMVTPGIPGDSGSGYMDDDHCAWGVTSTLQAAPFAASNGISSVKLGVAYAAANNGPDVTIGTAAPQTILPF